MAERSIPRQLLTAAVAESGVFTVNDAVAVGTDETFLGIVLADKQRNAGCDAFFHQPDFSRGKLYVKNDGITWAVFSLCRHSPGFLLSQTTLPTGFLRPCSPGILWIYP